MKVERLDYIDWESISMTLHAERELSDEEVGRVRQLLETWPKENAPQKDDEDSYPVPDWHDSHDGKILRFSWEKWFPNEWIESLAAALEAELPSLTLLEIGINLDPPFRDDAAFIVVPHKVVEFEDGTKVEVQSFEIAKYTVSIGQFDRFTREAGYVTIGEQRGYETFRDNQFIGPVPANKRQGYEAFCISYQDALAYCEWARVRLPTEAEWLAAALIDDQICEDEEFPRRYSELRDEPAALVKNCDEMTGTVVNGRSVVVRSGPHLVRARRDLQSKSNRRVQSFVDCEDPIQFRICK